MMNQSSALSQVSCRISLDTVFIFFRAANDGELFAAA